MAVKMEVHKVSIFFSVMAMLFLWMGPVTGPPPSVLAPPIPQWGPSAAGVAEEAPCHPSSLKGNCHNNGKKDASSHKESLE